MRVYLPATTAVLRRLVDEGRLDGPHTAFAVTDALRRFYAVSDADAEDDVRAAVNVVLEADLGSEDAQFVVDQAEGHELAWYATQEIGPVLDLL